MLVALLDSGWRNYSLFLGADGLLIGYFEADSVSTALAAMSQQDVNQRWQSAMSGMIVDADLHRLSEVFNLGEQLHQASSSNAGSVDAAAASEPSSSQATSPGLSRSQPPRSGE
jgi:L-rhamnose mutarotase